MATEHWGFFSMPHQLWHGISLYLMILKDSWHSTYCRAFGNGAVNTCIKDIGLLGLGFKHTTFHLQGNALIHCTTTAVWWSYPCSVLLWYWIQSVYILFTGGGDDRILVQYSSEWYPDTGQLPNPRPVPDTAGHRGSLSLLCQKGLLS